MHKNKNTRTTLLAAGFALSLGLSACQRPAENNNAKELEKLNAKMDLLTRKIDGLNAQQRRPQPPAQKRPTVGQLYNVSVDERDAFRGGKDAKVTIVEASEFACPYCFQLAVVTDGLLEAFEDEELKVVSKHFIVHPSVATKPALAACAANAQGKFADYERALWKSAWPGGDRARLDSDKLGDASLESIAKEVGLDLVRFKSDMAGECQGVINRNRKEMTTLGVGGTPALYINGVYYGGPRTLEGLKAAVEAEIKKTDAALAKGARLEGYYAQLVAKGKATL